jgi:hypothetical protein
LASSTAAWSRAFAVQAKADLAARDVLLLADSLPICEHLHFLQMACEKVAKAHRCWDGKDPKNLLTHGVTEKVISLIAKQLFARGVLQDGASRKSIDSIRELAREVELLAPTVKDGNRRPDNCEYPWEDSQGVLHIPAEHHFRKLDDLASHPIGGVFLKVVVTAVEELAGGFYISK